MIFQKIMKQSVIFDSVGCAKTTQLNILTYSKKYFFRLPVIVLQRVLFVLMIPSLQIHVYDSVKYDSFAMCCSTLHFAGEEDSKTLRSISSS